MDNDSSRRVDSASQSTGCGSVISHTSAGTAKTRRYCSAVTAVAILILKALGLVS